MISFSLYRIHVKKANHFPGNVKENINLHSYILCSTLCCVGEPHKEIIVQRL
jgi:hypothetical protein